MSVFRWRYDETCEGRYCCGDCDKCDKEYAVRTFDDIERVIKMITEEAQAKLEEALNERFN